MPATGIPVVTDVTFRISEGGDMIGMDFECRDGAVRSVAFPATDLSKLLAGFLWAGDESATRQVPSAVDEALKARLRDGARSASDWKIARYGGEQYLEVTVGAAFLSVRLPQKS